MSGEQIRRIWRRGEIAAEYFRPTGVNAPRFPRLKRLHAAESNLRSASVLVVWRARREFPSPQRLLVNQIS